jgi:hypothetical protein
MRYWFALLMLLTLMGGCGPKLSQRDLGTVVFELPKIAGAEGPYPMPQLQSQPEVSEDHTKP